MDLYYVIVLCFFKFYFFTHKTLVLVLLLPPFASDRVKLPSRRRLLWNEGREGVGSRLTFWRRRRPWKRERRLSLRLPGPCRRCLQRKSGT